MGAIAKLDPARSWKVPAQRIRRPRARRAPGTRQDFCATGQHIRHGAGGSGVGARLTDDFDDLRSQTRWTGPSLVVRRHQQRGSGNRNRRPCLIPPKRCGWWPDSSAPQKSMA